MPIDQVDPIVPIDPVDPIVPIDPIDSIVPDDVPKATTVLGRKSLAWARQTLQEAEGHLGPCGSFKESKRPQ